MKISIRLANELGLYILERVISLFSLCLALGTKLSLCTCVAPILRPWILKLHDVCRFNSALLRIQAVSYLNLWNLKSVSRKYLDSLKAPTSVC